MRERFALTWHGLIYRLVLGAIVLAMVVPTTASGAEPVWPFVLAAVAVVILGILVGHRPPVRAGLVAPLTSKRGTGVAWPSVFSLELPMCNQIRREH
jgi:hypothetical protein